MVREVCSGRGSGRDGGCVPVGAAAHRCAVFQQQERHVIVGVTAGVPVHGFHQGLQCLVAVSCEKRRCDRVFGEEAPAGVAAFDNPVGVEQQPVAGRPGRTIRGEVILKAKRQRGLPAGQRPQVAAVALTSDVNPERLLGAASEPLAVAVILYDAGLSLDLSRLRGQTRRVVIRLIAVGSRLRGPSAGCWRRCSWACPPGPLRVGWRPRSRSWWITLANLIGSAAFGVPAVASHINRAAGQLHNAEGSILGTFAGAFVLLDRALLLLPAQTEEASDPVTTPAASDT